MSGDMNTQAPNARLTPERLAEIRVITTRVDSLAPEYTTELIAELDAVTRERDALRKATGDLISCHDSGGYESEGQAFDALRAVYDSANPGKDCDCHGGWRGNLVFGTLRRCERGCEDQSR